DDTAAVRLWESRSLPRFKTRKAQRYFSLGFSYFKIVHIKLNIPDRQSEDDALRRTCYKKLEWYQELFLGPVHFLQN
ncbi:MAG TPA: hypothetical protein PKK23_21250, partial [Nitrospirales bacterium]|nr:hypothetical protein [Nitrospirales bacterium]